MTWMFVLALILLLSGLFARATETGAAALARSAAGGWCAFAAATGIALAGALSVIEVTALAAMAMLLTTLVGAVVLAFSARYMRADRDRGGFAAKVSLLLAAILLFVAARDVVTLALGWIAASWLLAALIGHARDWPEAQSARRRTLATLAIGDAALVAGLALLAGAAGTIEVDALIAKSPSGPMTVLAMLLLVVAAISRSALPPFSGWLGRSMTAPTPVSALMHAGFVNGGGLLLIRFAPLLEAAPAARALAIAAGLAAIVYGTGSMMVRPDIKRSLAGSTVAQMGFTMLSCGLGAYAAALWHLVAHGLFKAWLFLRSGSAIGLARPAANPAVGPVTIAVAGTAALAALALTGTAAPTLLPAGLALATLLASIPALVRQPATLPGVAGSIALYAGGLALTHSLLATPEGSVIGGMPLLLILGGTIVAAWAAQAALLAGRLRLPPALYARLLNI